MGALDGLVGALAVDDAAVEDADVEDAADEVLVAGDVGVWVVGVPDV
ncbi:MAG: hypothetical protein M3070_12605 [Actinomycetota bacterium]|nr:hypothetical protein [Actinomycetota bacterium]